MTLIWPIEAVKETNQSSEWPESREMFEIEAILENSWANNYLLDFLVFFFYSEVSASDFNGPDFMQEILSFEPVRIQNLLRISSTRRKVSWIDFASDVMPLMRKCIGLNECYTIRHKHIKSLWLIANIP